MTPRQRLAEASARISAQLGEVDALPWLSPMRRAAREHFRALGLPTTRLEEWKQTSVVPLAGVPFRLVSPPASARPPDGFAPGRRTSLVFVNGRLQPSSSQPDGRGQGKGQGLEVTLRDLASMATSELEPYLGRLATLSRSAFAALNTALFEGGAFVQVPAGLRVEHPIHLVFLSSVGDQPAMVQPRVLIRAGAGSQATVVEWHLGVPNEVYCSTAVTELYLEPNATVEYVRLVGESPAAFHIGRVQASQDRDSRLDTRTLTIGSRLVRSELFTAFDAEGAECNLDGLYAAGSGQHVDHHTTIDHKSAHCASRELYKGVLDGDAHGVFNGKIVIRPDAGKSDARQTNKNLLLSDAASIHTKPELEIRCNDVKCAHGAAIGHLDADALFYLRARGIDEPAARKLLVWAFTREIAERIGNPSVRAGFDALLERQLAGRGTA